MGDVVAGGSGVVEHGGVLDEPLATSTLHTLPHPIAPVTATNPDPNPLPQIPCVPHPTAHRSVLLPPPLLNLANFTEEKLYLILIRPVSRSHRGGRNGRRHHVRSLVLAARGGLVGDGGSGVDDGVRSHRRSHAP